MNAAILIISLMVVFQIMVLVTIFASLHKDD